MRVWSKRGDVNSAKMLNVTRVKIGLLGHMVEVPESQCVKGGASEKLRKKAGPKLFLPAIQLRLA